MNKKLPYGISNFKNLIEDKYLYIDKTEYIEKIENFHSPYIIFLRPRRFGKSLFTSVLANYYDINEKDNFEKLFGETYIGKNVTREKNSYYILKFNFTGLNTDTKEDLEKTFIRTIKDSFDKFIEIYNLDISYIQEGSAASIFENFLTQVSFKIKGQIYVIIDEYDHFANELLSFQTELFSSIVSKTGFVRKFYEVLKKGTEFIVKRIFMTGVSPITLDSLTSGFNIAMDITRYPAFNEMMGFTKAEVIRLIDSTVKKPLDEVELKELLETLQKNYNGYLFASNGKERLFNSDMILYYMQSYMDSGKGPESLIDKNIASDYGKLGRMFDLKNKDANMEVLQDILKEEEIEGNITEGFSLEKNFDQDDFKSILFYLGLLTIDKPILGGVSFKVPNYVIKELYFEYFSKKINEELNYELNTPEITKAIREIGLKGKNDNLIKIVEKTLNKLSNRDYIKFDEKYVKLIFLAYCFLSKIYLVKSEYEVDSGYIDIALLKQANMEPTYFAIFELKYITKAEYEKEGEKIIEEKKKEAIEQLQKYKASQELMGLPNLKKWALVFVNDSCVVNIEIEQELI
ncbi:ATP-binding protein [Clostridium magnum]|uniref:Putative AAA-ATPase n=1 Tax=Clostridium magnum DSM 2767 TaxID=1121326 RepID=A0A161WPV8_9CLOT|nr:ATP-binding protein [Clostridium magnum]KZL88608.1 putative AAA-ATPase [Clostridium magnum DSM 2767]